MKLCGESGSDTNRKRLCHVVGGREVNVVESSADFPGKWNIIRFPVPHPSHLSLQKVLHDESVTAESSVAICDDMVEERKQN